MYKPGTQLIINELWARETAEKLGFELTGGYRTVEGTWFPHRIVVTSDGPNAAERFLPQVGDVLRGFSMPDKYAGMISKDFMSEWLRRFSAVKIIERNGIPFPQFSEVIEP